MVDIGGIFVVGRRYFSGNPKVGQSGKSRQVPTLHPTTPPAKREGLLLLIIIIIKIIMIKRAGGTPEARSDKSLTLLTFDI